MRDDTLRRDDMQPRLPFDDLPQSMRAALRRAANRDDGVDLPSENGRTRGLDHEGWIMVPSKRGLRQVAYKGKRAWRF